MEPLARLTPYHFEQMERLEQSFYSNEHITPSATAYAWYVKYPYTVVAAADGDGIAGFINMFPVKEAVFERLLAGTFNDSELCVDDIADIAAPGDATLYMFLCCAAVKAAYRPMGLTHALLRAATAQYEGVAQHIDTILADTVTPQGERFVQRYGFSPLGRSDHASRMYAQSYGRFRNAVLG